MTDFNTPELAGFDLPNDVDSGDAAQVPQAKPAQAAKPVGPNPFTALGLHVAALRETFEESGLLLGQVHRVDLAQRVRKAGTALSMQQNYWHTPPVAAIFLHRKMAGLYLLAARLKAHVNVRQLLDPYLAS